MMHANVDELLQIKDGDDIAIKSHVTSCNHCQQVLKELINTQEQLQNLTATVPENAWQHIQSEYQDMNKPHQNFQLTKAIYSLVATVLITGAGVIFMLSQYSTKENSKHHMMMQLIADSNTLENIIAVKQITNETALSQQASFRIDTIKWRLMLIDQKIQSVSSSDIDKKIALWQDRIRALQAINCNYNQLKRNGINQQIL